MKRYIRSSKKYIKYQLYKCESQYLQGTEWKYNIRKLDSGRIEQPIYLPDDISDADIEIFFIKDLRLLQKYLQHDVTIQHIGEDILLCNYLEDNQPLYFMKKIGTVS